MITRRTFSKLVGAGATAASLTGAAASPAAAAATTAGDTRGPEASTGGIPARDAASSAAFESIKQIDAGVLSIGYAELGPADGPAVVCLHGWPYDIHSYVEVAPLLADLGYRVIVPYFRGHGTTVFRSKRTPRNAQQSVIALDIIALMDALGIEKAVLAGYDWGSRTADIIAALWPQRCKALVSVTGYVITNRAANKLPSAPSVEFDWWYQYYFATERGELGLTANRAALAELVWRFNSPSWDFDEATFQRTAAAFENPDYVSIVIDNYRWRLSLVDGDPRYDGLEARLAKAPDIAVPTVTLDGALDPFTPAGDGSAYRAKFAGEYAHRTLDGIGHNVPQEAPEAFAQAVVDADRL